MFAKPHLLLTSRSYQTYNLPCDVTIAIQKFIDEDIKNYIIKYFHRNDEKIASECWPQIRDYKHLKETVQIPACLEIVCYLWDCDECIFQSDMTMSQLYQKMCEYLLRRYLLKVHKQDTSAVGENGLYQQPNARAFHHLESLAFQATKNHKLTITGKEIADTAGSPFLCVLQIGLLIGKKRKLSSVLADNIYYFVHRSFQEYLCARYMINILSSNYSEEQKKEVIRFITNEKYDRDLQHTFRLFFDLQPSVECSDEFWQAVDSEPRDLVGIRHCSRIIQWFPDDICGSSEVEKVKRRTIEIIQTWIRNKERRAHDYGNTYLFEWFASMIKYRCWLEAWKDDLFVENPSSRRYFLPDLWSSENIHALRSVFENISKKQVKLLYRVITEGPTARNLQALKLDSNLFTLYGVNNQNETQELLTVAQRKAIELQSVTTLEEFQSLLQNYAGFANLNHQTVAVGKEIWRLKIDPSALENIDHITLELLLHLIEEDTLFDRYFELPVVPFLHLYAKQTDRNDDILLKLIVSITFSTGYILTAPPYEKNMIHFPRIRENDLFMNIEFDERRRHALVIAFYEARDSYGYSCFFQY